jgi:heme exporter protein D
MQWHSVGEFLAMGGYALYVWGSVGVCALALIVEPWALRRKHRRLLRSLRRRGATAGARASAVAVEVTR